MLPSLTPWLVLEQSVSLLRGFFLFRSLYSFSYILTRKKSIFLRLIVLQLEFRFLFFCQIFSFSSRSRTNSRAGVQRDKQQIWAIIIVYQSCTFNLTRKEHILFRRVQKLFCAVSARLGMLLPLFYIMIVNKCSAVLN